LGCLASSGRRPPPIRGATFCQAQFYSFQPLELYDLKSDPQETTELAAKNRKMFNELAAALRQQIQRAGAVPWQAPEHTP